MRDDSGFVTIFNCPYCGDIVEESNCHSCLRCDDRMCDQCGQMHEIVCND